ncbi:MAG TPA: SdpI family protein [Anaerolineales bacterium]|nr:SdpI family protein [Anaerolineales bacterium]
MSTRTTTILVLVMLIGATIAGLLLWNRLPEQVASHWNFNDEVDGYMPRFWGVFLMPLITLGMLVLFLVIPAIDPLKANIAEFREAFNLFIVLIIAFLLYVYGLTLAWNVGYTGFRISTSLLPAIGLLFIFIGFMLRQARRNFFIGIRTPWTLSSDRVWEKTHRIGSTLFMLAGAFAIIGSFFGGATAFWMLMIPIFGSTIFLVIYSYILYKQETNV